MIYHSASSTRTALAFRLFSGQRCVDHPGPSGARIAAVPASAVTEDQIIGVLHEHKAGVKTVDLCRKHGVSDAALDNWQAKCGGMTV